MMESSLPPFSTTILPAIEPLPLLSIPAILPLTSPEMIMPPFLSSPPMILSLTIPASPPLTLAPALTSMLSTLILLAVVSWSMLIPLFPALMLLPGSRMILPKWVSSGLLLPPSSKKLMPFDFDSMVPWLVRVPILLPDSINTPSESDLIVPSLVK
ncbi:Uncharacterised protein [Campylobacter jejuni]|nr:Uncharacterised protein [Campylobacter jejuni]